MICRERLFLAWKPLAIAASVIVISWLHYVTSYHSVVLHELFQRLYHVPIVVAAVMYGLWGGLATSTLSALLFLPHVVLEWHAWEIFKLDQYAEVIVFIVVAAVTGLLADRRRAERNRYRGAAAELDRAYHRLEVGSEERLRLDRLVTIGRLASGIAHQIRNPLGAMLGSLEILAADFPAGHPKAEFVAIAKGEIQRLERVVTSFLDFAHPPRPTSQPLNLRTAIEAAVSLARPTLTCRRIDVDVQIPDEVLPVDADVDQVQRALLNILLANASAPQSTRLQIQALRTPAIAQVTILVHGRSADQGALADLFEPFQASDFGHGLELATARRLIENQRGTVRAECIDGHLAYVLELPVSRQVKSVDPLSQLAA